MLNKITDSHQQRLACVYIRQSTIEQVRSNRESTRRQQHLADRAEQLGWQRERIIVIDEDLGRSAAVTIDERPGYQKALQLISSRQVGIILAVEISRLAREDISWQIMFRHCQFMDVLLADEDHVYNPLDPHEQMMLGLLATFAGFELNVLRQRMQQAWRQKADRGELFCHCPPGYVIEDNRMIKTPDQRVQRIVELTLAQFPAMPSAGALCRWCCEQGLQIPVSRSAHGRDIEWKEPDSKSLLRLFRNPAYAGTYVIGQKKSIEKLLPDGQICKQTVRLPMDQWSRVIHDHHEPYISWEQFTKNYYRLQRKTTNHDPARQAVGKGEALLSGLLRCRRCGYGPYVRYNAKGAARYLCLAGGRQREGKTKTCFSFPGKNLDELISAQLLEVVRPAGIEAAVLAAEKLVIDFDKQRQVLADQAEHCRYETERARRQYDQVDPENRLVCGELERRWNERLTALVESENRLNEFNARRPTLPSATQQEALFDLGRNLPTVWYSDAASMQVKKQILRLLIEKIIVDIDSENQIQIVVHWIGGHHSEHALPRRTQRSHVQTLDPVQTIKSLSLIADDAQQVRMLNRAGIRTPRGATWTEDRVAAFRRRHKMPSYDPEEKKRRGLLLQEEAASRLKISPMSVHRLLTSGTLSGCQINPGLPWLIEADALDEKQVITAVAAIQKSAARPVDNPNQGTLW